MLVDYGADVKPYLKILDTTGDSLLTDAYRRKKRSLIKTLLNNGVDVDGLNYFNESVISMALAAKNPIDLLFFLHNGGRWSLGLSEIINSFSHIALCLDYSDVNGRSNLLYDLVRKTTLNTVATNIIFVITGIRKYSYSDYSQMFRPSDSLATNECQLLILPGYRPSSSEVDAFRAKLSTEGNASLVMEKFLNWLEWELTTVPRLMQQCRLVIRCRLTEGQEDKNLNDILKNEQLGLPTELKRYLIFGGTFAECHVENIVHQLLEELKTSPIQEYPEYFELPNQPGFPRCFRLQRRQHSTSSW